MRTFSLAAAYIVVLLFCGQALAKTEVEYLLMLQTGYSKLGLSPDDYAIKVITESSQTDPDDQANLGVALSGVKAHFRAIEVLPRAIRLNPNHARAHLFLGLSHYWLDQCDRAIPAFKRGIELTGDDSSVWKWHSFLGRCYFHLKDYTNALSSCSRGVGLSLNRADGLLCIAKSQIALARYDEAIGTALKIREVTMDKYYTSRANELVLASLYRQGTLARAAQVLNLTDQIWTDSMIESVASTTSNGLGAGRSWQE